MDADILKSAFKLASHAVKHYDDALRFNTDGLSLVIKPLISKSNPKLKVIFRF